MKKTLLLTIPIVFVLAMGLVQAVPQSQDNTTSIASGSAWDCSVTYGFQINWTDTEAGGFDNATLQLGNDEGSLTNYTIASTPAVANTTPSTWYVNFTQDQLGRAGTYNYTWIGINTTGSENATSTVAYSVSKATPVLGFSKFNDTYITINETTTLFTNITDDACFYKYTNLTVKAYVQKAYGSKNYTLRLKTDLNYTYNFTKAQFGDGTSNCTRVNVTHIYVDGNANYSSLDNSSTNYADFGTTTALTVTAPSSLDYGKTAIFKTNYTATNGDLITQNCSLSFINTYDFEFSSGYQQASFTSPHTDTGTQGYTVTCSNNSYQTQTATGSVIVSGSGASGGGGPTPIVTTIMTTTPTEPVCGNGICEEGEHMWDCWKDCNPFKPMTTQETGEAATTITPTTIAETGEGQSAANPLVILIIIGIVAYLILKK